MTDILRRALAALAEQQRRMSMANAKTHLLTGSRDHGTQRTACGLAVDGTYPDGGAVVGKGDAVGERDFGASQRRLCCKNCARSYEKIRVARSCMGSGPLLPLAALAEQGGG